jgi:hypothetical protein
MLTAPPTTPVAPEVEAIVSTPLTRPREVMPGGRIALTSAKLARLLLAVPAALIGVLVVIEVVAAPLVGSTPQAGLGLELGNLFLEVLEAIQPITSGHRLLLR